MSEVIAYQAPLNAGRIPVSTDRPLPVTGTGVAGTPAGGVESVQGVSGGTPIAVSTGLQSTSPYTVAAVSVSSSGDNTIIAAVAAKTSKVYRLVVTAASPVDIAIKDDTTVLGTFQNVVSLTLEDTSGNPLFAQAVANKNFILNLSSAVAVKGTVWYVNS